MRDADDEPHKGGDGLAEGATGRFVFRGQCMTLRLEGTDEEEDCVPLEKRLAGERAFGGDRLLRTLAKSYQIQLRTPGNPYGKIVYLVHPNSGDVVDIDRDFCQPGVVYQVRVEPPDGHEAEGWNLAPSLFSRLLTADPSSGDVDKADSSEFGGLSNSLQLAGEFFSIMFENKDADVPREPRAGAPPPPPLPPRASDQARKTGIGLVDD